MRLTDAVNAVGQVTPTDVRIVDRFYAANMTGASSGPERYPANAWNDAFALNTNYPAAKLRFEQLDTNKLYSFVFFVARAGLMSFTIGSSNVSLQGTGNITNTVLIAGVSASSSGTVDIAASIDTNTTTLSYLCVMELGILPKQSSSPVYYSLKVNGMAGGLVSPTGGVYSAGSNVQISATTSQCYHFVSWTGSVTSANATTSVLMDTNKTVWAVFAENMYTNGVPATWLVQHGLPESDAGAASDTDGDGLLAWQEYIAGTVPTNGNSVFALSNGWTGAQNIVIRWPAASNRNYQVTWSSNLVSGFEPLSGDIPGPQNMFTDTIHGTEISGFYKMDVRMNP
jgi:hypothetical protein